MGVSKPNTTETDPRKKRRQRRLEAKLCSKEAERENQRQRQEGRTGGFDDESQIKQKHFIEELADRIEAERLRQLEENREKALQTQLERLTRLVEEKADSEIFLNRMLALYGKGNPQDRESELKSFTYHVRDFNRAWYTLPGTLEGQGKRVRVCRFKFHCRQIINRNKDEKVEV